MMSLLGGRCGTRGVNQIKVIVQYYVKCVEKNTIQTRVCSPLIFEACHINTNLIRMSCHATISHRWLV